MHKAFAMPSALRAQGSDFASSLASNCDEALACTSVSICGVFLNMYVYYNVADTIARAGGHRVGVASEGAGTRRKSKGYHNMKNRLKINKKNLCNHWWGNVGDFVTNFCLNWTMSRVSSTVTSSPREPRNFAGGRGLLGPTLQTPVVVRSLRILYTQNFLQIVLSL